MYLRRYLSPVLLACVGALLVLGMAGAKQGDVNSECVYNAGQVATGVAAYAQDWDETFPPMKNETTFQQIIAPYTHSTTVFTCPATQLPYARNLTLSGMPESIISDLGRTWAVKDAKPHADGLKTVAYLDGHVTRGGVDQADPNVECVGDAKQLVLATWMYFQDYGQAPPMQTMTAYLTAVYPYVKSHRKFRCPATTIYYKLNPALSGQDLNSISNPSSVEVLRDARPHADGKSTIAYLDGHVVRQ